MSSKTGRELGPAKHGDTGANCIFCSDVLGRGAAGRVIRCSPSSLFVRAQYKKDLTQPVEMALEAALLVIQNGGSTVAAERSLRNILTGYRKEGVSPVWRLDFIAASSTDDGQSSTVVRQVGPIGVNLVRPSEVAMLSERVAKGEVDTALGLGTGFAIIRLFKREEAEGV